MENFRVQTKSTSQGVSYDFRSIMHFRHNAFAHSCYRSTIVPRNHTIPITILGSSANATDFDFMHLNLLYCGGTGAKFMQCCSFGSYLIRCCSVSLSLYENKCKSKNVKIKTKLIINRGVG